MPTKGCQASRTLRNLSDQDSQRQRRKTSQRGTRACPERERPGVPRARISSSAKERSTCLAYVRETFCRTERPPGACILLEVGIYCPVNASWKRRLWHHKPPGTKSSPIASRDKQAYVVRVNHRVWTAKPFRIATSERGSEHHSAKEIIRHNGVASVIREDGPHTSKLP